MNDATKTRLRGALPRLVIIAGLMYGGYATAGAEDDCWVCVEGECTPLEETDLEVGYHDCDDTGICTVVSGDCRLSN